MKEASGDVSRKAENAGVTIRVLRFSSRRFMHGAPAIEKNRTNSTD
jgi:hypothetical protein